MILLIQCHPHSEKKKKNSTITLHCCNYPLHWFQIKHEICRSYQTDWAIRSRMVWQSKEWQVCRWNHIAAQHGDLSGVASCCLFCFSPVSQEQGQRNVFGMSFGRVIFKCGTLMFSCQFKKQNKTKDCRHVSTTRDTCFVFLRLLMFCNID